MRYGRMSRWQLFGDSVWGAAAGSYVLLVPMILVIVYLYAAWLSRLNPWFVAIVGVGLGGGLFPGVDIRFILVPVTCIMIAETLRRPGRTRTAPLWTVGLTLLLFVQAILAPETSFLVAPALACVVAADLLHREPDESWWRRLRRTRWCAATGAVTLVIFIGFMAWHGAVGAWMDYYLVNAVSHNAVGAIPPSARPYDYRLWGAATLAALVTGWAAVQRLRARADWRPEDWMALAVAFFVLVYGEKAVGRLDYSHVWQVYGAGLSLTLFWLWHGLGAADRVVASGARAVLSRYSARHARRTTTAWSIRTVSAVLVLAVLWHYAPARSLLTEDVPRALQQTGDVDPRYSAIGYTVPGTVDTAMIDDLDRVLLAYAGADGTVFDMTNSLGYVYYLLGRRPATRFASVSLAVTPYSQQLLIDELRRSRPSVVIFDSTKMGNPGWDWITNNVRHFDVSRYVLDNWVPVLRTHGNLILLRRDLAASGPPVPALIEPPVTTDLWFSPQAPCEWGASLAYLPSIPVGAARELPVTTLGSRRVVSVTGWAADPATGRSATVVGVAGSQVIGTVMAAQARPDVAAAAGTSTDVGFRFTGVADPNAALFFYLLGSDGRAYPLDGSSRGEAPSLELPDGRRVPTTTTTAGHLEADNSVVRLVQRVDVPAGLRLADYGLATVSAGPTGLGNAQLTLTDEIGQAGHDINASSVAWANPDLPMRVGSCLQWRGYDSSRPLYLLQSGGNPVTSITLSDVRTR